MNEKRLRISVMVLLLGGMVMSACAKHDDFPPMIPVATPPNPTSFTVAPDGPANIIFNLTWSINRPADVQFYNLYFVDPFSGRPAFIDSTTTTAAQVNLGASLPGATFGVASVTTENVESSIIFASASDE